MNTGVIIMICVVIAALLFILFAHRDYRAAKRKTAKQRGDADEKTAEELMEKLQQTVDRLGSSVSIPAKKDPKVEALRAAAGKSLRLNLMAEQAAAQMASVASLNRSHAVPQGSPQDEPWYRRAEWNENDDFLR